jgi:hypothetical protein
MLDAVATNLTPVAMTTRSAHVDAFIRIATVLFQSDAQSLASRDFAARVFEKLKEPSDDGKRQHERYSACEWIDRALAPLINEPSPFGAAARAIKALEPELGWARRSSGSNGSDNYIEGHVHGMICGPRGAESRYDVQLGFSIMVPHVRYPDHSHPPEEAYVLFTEGDFRQLDGEWFHPGIGGGIHNPPHGRHAMRSGAAPFFAIWCLLT